MNIVLIGMNHKTAPLEIRERLPLSSRNNVHPLLEMIKIPQIKEAFYLSTCNRVEALASAVDAKAVVERLKEFIFPHGDLTSEEMARCLYVYFDHEAVRHLFRVASSIDSLVMGEPQILGQVKEAYRQAAELRTTGVILNRVVHHAFRVAKRVRTETEIASNAVSVSFAAVELAKKIFGALKGKTVLLIGAGEMSELAARHLIKYGVDRILIANRTYTRALEMARDFHAGVIEFDRLGEGLRDADIVISSTGAPGYVINAEMVAAALHRRKSRLLFLIDIAVPRDIDPAAGNIDNVYLYNIDNLQEIVDENLNNRRREAEKAEAIIEEEALKYREWFGTLKVVPTIVSLREKVEGIITGELGRSLSWMRNLSPEQRKNVEILASSILNKVLHDPIAALKEESQNGGALPYIAALRRLFRLDDG
ncbi:MAG: glutamyl-tRNA reductase [Syntrophaceae bacterium CG2_30_49_12]|nr:MAG: glutamyl-tRNA reductase [Syntrophaceae bacterium CG2_30_49_12]PIP04944.1 MAG: glutamyl-tRNA reductase [Syntrophobacterales bacterium CG23_combo_of_CG06-09_8_20_14_all_48_27]PJC72793.1 MAG: glutamyl-tRNA reductase [Syntrophobacterales bacterium CG_4_8_14_3_um_filter_49_14]